MPTTLSGQTYITQQPFRNPIQKIQDWFANQSWNPVTQVKAFEPTNTPAQLSPVGSVSAQAPMQSAVNPTVTVNPVVRQNSVPQTPVPQTPDYSQLDQQQGDYDQIIEEEYNNANNALAGDEQSLRERANNSISSINTGYQDVLNQLGNEQTTNEQGVDTTLKTGETESKDAMRTARELFRDTEQHNIAQLSGLGLSSSSVTEALAERLGVETMRRLNGITGSLTEIRLNAVKEMNRIKTYFEGRKTTLANEKVNREAEINQSLLDGIRQIQQSRDANNTAKAAKRMDLFYNIQAQKADLNKQFQAFEQSLATFAAKKIDAVAPLTTTQFYQQFQDQLGTIQKNFSPSQFNYNPSITTDQYGRMKSTFGIKPKTQEELDALNAGTTPETTNDPTDPAYWN